MTQRPRAGLVQTTMEENVPESESCLILPPDQDVLMKALTIYGHIDAATMRSGIPSRAARGIFTLCWRILAVSQRIGGIEDVGVLGVLRGIGGYHNSQHSETRLKSYKSSGYYKMGGYCSAAVCEETWNYMSVKVKPLWLTSSLSRNDENRRKHQLNRKYYQIYF